MDLKFSTIAWFDNIYHTIEGFFHEMDDIAATEAAKLADSLVSMQTVGENIREFGTEVLQDLLPPSSEASLKGPVGDLSVKSKVDAGMSNKLNIVIEGFPVNMEPTPPVELKVTVSVGKDLSPASSYCRPQCNSHEGAPDLLAIRSVPTSDGVTGHHCSQKAGENDPDVPSVPPSSQSLLAVASHDSKVLESGQHCSQKSGENDNNGSDPIACITDFLSVDPFPESVTQVLLDDEKVLEIEHDCSQNSGQDNNNVADAVSCTMDLSSPILSFESVTPAVVHSTEVLEGGPIQSVSVLSVEAIGAHTSHETMSLKGPPQNVHEEHIAITEKSSDVDEVAYKGKDGHDSVFSSKDTIEFKDVDHEESFVDPGKIEFNFIGDVDEDAAYKGHDGHDSVFSSKDTTEFKDVDHEESFADPGKIEFNFIAFRANENRSFKKKLCDVFTSRKHSSKKKNFEQWESWVDDLNMEAEQRAGMSISSTTLRNLDTKKLASRDFYESDWELVEVDGITPRQGKL